MNSRFCYVGDFGQTPISDETLYAWDVAFLINEALNWRRSSIKRRKVQEFFAAMSAVQKYHWLKHTELTEL